MEYEPKTSKLEKVIGFVKEMRIEPFLLIFMFGYYVRDVTMQSVMMEKACLLNLGKPQDICSNLDDHESIKKEVQKIALNYRIGVMLISFIPAIISSTLLTPWSDVYGRKFPIMAALFGVILEGIGSTIVASISSAPLYFFLISHIPNGIFGGLIMAISSTYTYLSDVTTQESRSIRFAFLECFFILSNPLALEVGGQLYKYYGGVPVFITSVLAIVICFFWTLFLLKETRGLNKKKELRDMIKNLFKIENLKDSFMTCIAKRPGNLRAQIWLIILATSIYFFCAMGSSNIGFLFANRMYNWSNPKFSAISAVVRLTHGFGLIAIIPIFTKVLNMPDSIIGLIGILSYLGENCMKIAAVKEWVYLCGYIVGLVTGAVSVAARARLSKMVSQEELSKVFSLLALTESLTPLLSIVTFGPLYNATLDDFPGACYLLMTLLLAIAALIYIWIYKQGPLPTTSEINQSGYRMQSFSEELKT